MSIQLVAIPKAQESAVPLAVSGVLMFAEPGAEKPFTYAYEPPAGVARSNAVFRPQTVVVENARPLLGGLSVDGQGFQVVRQPSAVRDFWDEAQTLALGHPETADLVRAVTGASRVIVFDHTLRRRQDGTADRTAGAQRQPATRAHVDQTVLSGPQRVRDILGEAAAEPLLNKRAAIINVWRPVGHVARDWPLAVADARSVRSEDLVASDLVFPHRRGEIYGVAHHPGQRWFYVPDLAPGEAMLIKCWDSDEGVARFTPHTAFEDPTTPAGTPPRESIEFRTIAFFD